jgi:hypothetical protein
LTILAALVVLSSAIEAQNWPQFRGEFARGLAREGEHQFYFLLGGWP